MNPIRLNPPMPVKPPKLPFTQAVELSESGKLVGVAHWTSPADAAAGVIQLLDLHILPPSRRHRNGSRLLQLVIDQVKLYQRLHRKPLRRIWTAVQQKNQIPARAFLTQHGFHHVATVNDLYADEDLLIYMRSFD
jgi:GNAT superfamily N-acetyltransferase